jgi:anti-sigma B factor antagonist
MFERTRRGAVVVISGKDPLDVHYANSLCVQVDSAMAEGQKRIVLDMEHVPMVDSAGLETLLNLRDKLWGRGGALKLASVNPLCRDIFRVTGLDAQLDAYDDPVTAIGSFAQ